MATPEPVRLPEHLEEPTLGSMLVGESAWTVPWAMRITTDRRCYVDPRFTPHDRLHGTASMRLTRVPDGWQADLSEVGDFRWTPGDDGSSVVGRSTPPELLQPVIELIALP